MTIQQAIDKIIQHDSLSHDEMTAVMQQIMTGDATPAQIAGFLVGLRMKGETIIEIAAAAAVMRELATQIVLPQKNLVDIVGTGGDGAQTFNVSTASAFVVAAAGAHVAKHGNRAVSSRTGSADVLEAAGLNLNLSPLQVAECVNEVGIGFFFAPQHHTAMKYAAGPRKELGVRTLFNLLGPLTNPANTQRQVIGVYEKTLLEPLAQVLQKLGSIHALVVHSDDGLDEISIAKNTHIAELKNNTISTYQLSPEQFAMHHSDIEALRVNNSQESLAIIKQVFANQAGPAKDIVCLNAGAAIYVAGITDNIASGIEKAAEVIANGKAEEKFKALIALSNQY